MVSERGKEEEEDKEREKRWKVKKEKGERAFDDMEGREREINGPNI